MNRMPQSVKPYLSSNGCNLTHKSVIDGKIR